MRIAALGDVHANLPALLAVLADVDRSGADAIYCTGDVVGRGPHPEEVVAELTARQIPTVQGNWDEAVAMDREHSGAAWSSHEAEQEGAASLAWTRARLSDAARSWLGTLPVFLREPVEDRSMLVFHGGDVSQSEYLWADRPTRYFARVASDVGDDLFVFGHTHQSFHRRVAGAHFVSPGSVGCAAADDPHARWALLWVESGEVGVELRAVAYDRPSVLRDMAAARLPRELLLVPPHEQHLTQHVSEHESSEAIGAREET